MSNSISTYRVTNEDLTDLDKKTKDGLAPLIDGLNRTLGDVVPALNAQSSVDFRTVVFTTKSVVTDTFPIVINTIIATPQDVHVGRVQCPARTDTSLGITVNQWVQLSNGNISIQVISGLVANTKYQITIVVQ